MKKLLPLILITAVTGCSTHVTSEKSTLITTTTVDEHSAQYALDYAGVYQGTLPCADCSGIKTKLTLNKNGTFSYQQSYLEKSVKPFVETGSYQLTGNILTLPLQGQSLKLFVGESAIFYVDKNLRPYQGQLASQYQLHKQ